MRELFRAEGLPVLQNRTFETAAEAAASPIGNVVLEQDRTGLVRNAAFDASVLQYDRHYQNEQACSGVFQQHLEEVATVIGRHLRGRRLIEVGCGKGYFLEHLRRTGYEVTGIDPAYEGTDSTIIQAPFQRGLGLSAEGLVLRHVLEHIPDPVSFLSEIAHANGGRGTIYIEVPCFDWILQHRAWFDIFYEHVNYFRAVDFSRVFGRIYESGHIFGGQYLYVVADLATVRLPESNSQKISMPAGFVAGVERITSLIRSTGGRRNAIWGAASKGVIFSVYLQRAGIRLDAVIDINPAKQGRFLPVTALKVSPPEEAAATLAADDNLFVMNSNYLHEITTQSNGLYRYHTVDHE